jgi:predicted RNA-binding protein YlqC (UPF0109 family)
MKNFIEYIVKELVDKPDEVTISEVVGERTVVYELKVAHSDIGNVIGRRGRIVRSIQTLVSAISAKQKSKKPMLEVLKQERPDFSKKEVE